jgi:hypothetical protein
MYGFLFGFVLALAFTQSGYSHSSNGLEVGGLYPAYVIENSAEWSAGLVGEQCPGTDLDSPGRVCTVFNVSKEAELAKWAVKEGRSFPCDGKYRTVPNDFRTLTICETNSS